MIILHNSGNYIEAIIDGQEWSAFKNKQGTSKGLFWLPDDVDRFPWLVELDLTEDEYNHLNHAYDPNIEDYHYGN